MNFLKTKLSWLVGIFDHLFTVPNMDINYFEFEELERKKVRPPRTIREELFY